jgi:hypothetical protein
MLHSPVPPLCDLECQRKKKREALKNAMEKNKDYDSYVKYNTAAKGQGWLVNEKESVAKRDIDARLEAYINKFKELSGEQKKTRALGNLAKNLEENQLIESEDSKFLKKHIRKEKDKTEVLNRLNFLQSPQISDTSASIYSWIPYVLDLIILCLIGYLGYVLWGRYKTHISVVAQQGVQTASDLAQQGVQTVSNVAGQAASSINDNLSSR